MTRDEIERLDHAEDTSDVLLTWATSPNPLLAAWGGHLPGRVHIVGGSGTGKTTLARQLGALLEAPVHHLDEVAREVGTGRVRSVDERLEMVNEIATLPHWVTDGIHVGWTDELCRQADVIIWLDQVGWPTAMMRAWRRFLVAGLAETRRQGGLRGIFRPRSYARHLAEFYRASREIWAYDGRPRDAATGDGGSYAASVAQLTPFGAKVVHCRSRDDVERFVAGLARLVHDDPRLPDR